VNEKTLPQWANQIAVFDTETTGLDLKTARIVTATVVELDAEGQIVVDRPEWLADPEIEIPGVLQGKPQLLFPDWFHSLPTPPDPAPSSAHPWRVHQDRRLERLLAKQELISHLRLGSDLWFLLCCRR